MLRPYRQHARSFETSPHSSSLLCDTPRLSLLAPPHACGKLTPGVVGGIDWVGMCGWNVWLECVGAMCGCNVWVWCVGVVAYGMGHSIAMLFGEYIVAECWFGPTLASLYKAVPKEVQVGADTGWPLHPWLLHPFAVTSFCTLSCLGLHDTHIHHTV